MAAAAAWWLFWLTPSRGSRAGQAIRFGFWGDYQEYRMWERIAGEFRRRRPDIRIQLEHIPGSGEYARKMAAWLAGDALPDVMLLQDEPFPRYIDNRAGRAPVLVDLTALAAQAVQPGDYWPTAWESFGQREPDGWRQYALPVAGANNLILYNRQCFRRAGVELPERSGIDRDWTVQQFLDLCRRLTIRGAAGDGPQRTEQWGFDLPAGWLYWLPFIYACDADILSGDRAEFVFTGPAALRSLRLWRELIDERLVPRGGELGQMRQNVAFLTGRVALVCDGPWQMPFLNEAGLDYGAMFPPRSATGRRGTRVTWDGVGLAGRLAGDPARLAQAWAFAQFVAGQEAGRIIAQAQRSIPACRAAGEAFAAGSDPTRAGKFLAAMEFSRVQPITPQWSEMDSALVAILGRLTAGALTPEAALERMAESMVKRRLFPVRQADGTLRPVEGPP